MDPIEEALEAIERAKVKEELLDKGEAITDDMVNRLIAAQPGLAELPRDFLKFCFLMLMGVTGNQESQVITDQLMVRATRRMLENSGALEQIQSFQQGAAQMAKLSKT